MSKNRKTNIIIYLTYSMLLGYLCIQLYPLDIIYLIPLAGVTLFCLIALFICIFFDNNFSNRGRNKSAAEDLEDLVGDQKHSIQLGLGRCPRCYKKIARLATKCPHCTAEL
jgi:hypothetical protein